MVVRGVAVAQKWHRPRGTHASGGSAALEGPCAARTACERRDDSIQQQRRARRLAAHGVRPQRRREADKMVCRVYSLYSLEGQKGYGAQLRGERGTHSQAVRRRWLGTLGCGRCTRGQDLITQAHHRLHVDQPSQTINGVIGYVFSRSSWPLLAPPSSSSTVTRLRAPSARRPPRR